MVKLKELWNGPGRNSFIFLTVITLAFVFSILFLGDNNLVNLVKVEFELGRQQDQIEKELNIDMSNGREISQSDDHGGFHNEGTSCIVYRFADDSALNQIRKDNYIFEG